MQTCYQNIRKTRLSTFKVLFALCSDYMSAWHVIRTQGKQHFRNSTCCFPCVLIRLHADMLSQHKENNTLHITSVRNQCNNKVLCGHVIRTTGNRTFQAQSVRNQRNNMYMGWIAVASQDSECGGMSASEYMCTYL